MKIQAIETASHYVSFESDGEENCRTCLFSSFLVRSDSLNCLIAAKLFSSCSTRSTISCKRNQKLMGGTQRTKRSPHRCGH
mmetsp:Transcript_25905/g.58458  ORF Transcript_25905/g.58458 Transcript_25905/m.58458 type:complete len:81 (-) Transcript_25905:356-598(-)